MSCKRICFTASLRIPATLPSP